MLLQAVVLWFHLSTREVGASYFADINEGSRFIGTRHDSVVGRVQDPPAVQSRCPCFFFRPRGSPTVLILLSL